MDKSIKEYLINSNIKIEDYIVVGKTCNNITLMNKETRKRLDVRW